MTFPFTRRRLAHIAFVAGAALVAASSAAAQAVGSGPLTSSLASEEPQAGVIKMGPLRVAPGLVINQLGFDDNVFDEAVNPKEDWAVAATPDLAVFTRLRFVQVSAYGGLHAQYYRKYDTEQDIGYSLRGRTDILMSRVLPFVGGGRTIQRVRPNGEIDTRADIQTDEFSGGIAYQLSANAQMFGARIQTTTDFKDAFEDGISLETSLSRTTTEYQGGVATDLTPLLGMQLRGAFKRDEFRVDPLRNSDSYGVVASFSFDAAAVIVGSANIGYSDSRPADPTVKRFRGVVGSGTLTYPFREIGRFNFGYSRSTEYSFDQAEAYYLQNSFNLGYTQRLFGEVDLQALTSWAFFDYGNKEGSEERRDSLESYNGNLGYNLRNRTRISLNYEYARRRSPTIEDRNYIRRRVYLSWLLGF